MTDQQFQPGQTNPPVQTTQSSGVFGGSADAFADTTMFQAVDTKPAFQEPEFTLDHSIFTESIPVSEPVAPIVPEKIETPAPVVEVPTVIKEEVVEIKPEPVVQATPIAPIVPTPVTPEVSTEQKSDIRKKFDELVTNISVIARSLKLGTEDLIDVIGADNDKLTTLYQFGINETTNVIIKRIETDKETEESDFNELRFALEPDSKFLQVSLDDVLLFEEDELLEDAKKKSQVMDKLNKFVFLTGEKRKDIEKESKAKEEEERERRRLQDIFRNF